MNKTEKILLMFSGFAAILINTLILKLAKPLGIIAESGGLLKLILT